MRINLTILTGTVVRIIALGLLLLLAVFEYHSPIYISMAAFYLVPVALVTWFNGRRDGIITSLLSVLVLFSVHFLQTDSLTYLAYSWIAFTDLFTMIFVTFVLAAFRTSLQNERTLARIDTLTGLTNRRDFFDRADVEIKRALRYDQPLTLVYIDVDDFKGVNDRLGHSAGDALLRTTATTLKHVTRDVDVVARMGGDEFVLLLSDMSFTEAEEVIGRIRRSLDEAAGQKRFHATFSFGAVTCMRATCALEAFLLAADNLMYEVKRSGKNNYRHEKMKV